MGTDLQVQATANDVTEVQNFGLDAQLDFTFESAFVLEQLFASPFVCISAVQKRSLLILTSRHT